MKEDELQYPASRLSSSSLFFSSHTASHALSAQEGLRVFCPSIIRMGMKHSLGIA